LSNNISALKKYIASRAISKCASCSLRELCLPVGLDAHETEILGDLIDHKYKIQRGEYLLRAGMGFKSLYAVRNGFFKSYILDSEGRQQVTGFYMTGELLGLDAISSEMHTCDTGYRDWSTGQARQAGYVYGTDKRVFTTKGTKRKV